MELALALEPVLPLAVGLVPETPLTPDLALALVQELALTVVPACELAVELALVLQEDKKFTNLVTVDCVHTLVHASNTFLFFPSFIFLPYSIT